AERANHDGLRLAALEQRRTVRARQQPGLANDGTNRRGLPTVDAPLGVEHHRANDLRLAVLELAEDQLLELGPAFEAELRLHRLSQRLLQLAVGVVALVLGL